MGLSDVGIRPFHFSANRISCSCTLRVDGDFVTTSGVSEN